MPYQTESSELEILVQPVGGLISRVSQLTILPGEPNIPVFSASLGDRGHRRAAALHPEQARTAAISSALMHDAACRVTGRQWIVQTAEELGDAAIDSRLEKPQPDATLRWVQAVSLSSRLPVYVPAVTAYPTLEAHYPGEDVRTPISTGCAIHASLGQALNLAICDAVEQDALALTWLHQLPLPALQPDALDEEAAHLMDRTLASGSVRQYLFDATTDLGIPTILGIQLTPENEKAAAVVTCASAPDPLRALKNVLLQAASSRTAMNFRPHEAQDPFSKAKLLDAVRFLTDAPANRRRLSDIPSLQAGEEAATLKRLLTRLGEKQQDAYAVELTTEEAQRCGMRVVRVLLPGLQPLPAPETSPYLGRPRLFEAPRSMGFDPKREDTLNRSPLPLF